MKRSLRIIGYSVVALMSAALASLVGLISSAGLVMAPARAEQVATVVPRPTADHDPGKPTVAILLGNTRTEATDFLAPYAMFAESGEYNVYAVAESRSVRTLAGGVDVVPQLSFAELTARLGHSPDIIVVPALKDVQAPANAPVLGWLRQHGQDQTLLFSWCAGAEVLAASGLIDGRTVTTHWGDIGRSERAYPAVTWRRGERYIESGNLLTTGGITSGVDATLHLLALRNGQDVADKVAGALHYLASPYIDHPSLLQYTFEPVDAAALLNMAFSWPKRQAAVWLYDGVGEVDLAAVVEAYGLTSTNQTTTVSTAPAVVSRHGLQIVPRRQSGDLAAVDRVLVPGGNGANEAARRVPDTLIGAGGQVTVLQDGQTPTYAFTLALQDLAATHDVLTAEYAARQLEVRSPLHLAGPRWPLHLVVIPALSGIGGGGALWGLAQLASRVRGLRHDNRWPLRRQAEG
jgi:AraC family transcriptional regulator, transcriptional activator FtrA